MKEKRDGGPTSGDNLQAACRLHHSKKTRRHWLARIDSAGVARWRLPDGREYTTYPHDYREFGLDTLRGQERETGSSLDVDLSDAVASDPEPPDTVPVARADLVALESEVADARRQIDTLRAHLDSERTAHAATAAAYHEHVEANPPF